MMSLGMGASLFDSARVGVGVGGGGGGGLGLGLGLGLGGGAPGASFLPGSLGRKLGSVAVVPVAVAVSQAPIAGAAAGASGAGNEAAEKPG